MFQKGNDMKKSFSLNFRDDEKCMKVDKRPQSIMLNWNTELGALGMIGAGSGFKRN
jgi:hypothetical protein